MILRPLAAAALLLGLTACGTAVGPGAAKATSEPAPPDLAGHQFDVPDADRVLIAGQSTDLTLGTGRVRLTVNGPLAEQKQGLVGDRHRYRVTFRITAKVLSGKVDLSPARFSLLAIADQDAGATRVTSRASRSLATKGVTRTWTANFLEGHGEFLYTPAGTTRPAALWDFRVES